MAVLALDRDGNDAGHSRTPPAVVLDHLRAEPSRPLDPNPLDLLPQTLLQRGTRLECLEMLQGVSCFT